MKTAFDWAKLAPSDWRIHTVRMHAYTENHDWNGAINLAGPETPLTAHVRGVENWYPLGPILRQPSRTLVLLNGPAGPGAWSRAQTWSADVGLRPTSPWDVYALSRVHWYLNRTLGFEKMYVVATTSCRWHDGGECAIRVWWTDNMRRAKLPYVDDLVDPFAWYAYSE